MRNRLIAVFVIALVLIGAGLGWYFTRPVPVIETPAAEVRQPDNSLELARAPDAKAKPKQIIPKGAKVERVAQVTVQGPGLKMPDATTRPCPPVTVDLSLVRLHDETRRVLASSPDGVVLSGIDIPVESAAVPEPKPWAVGISMNPVQQTFGVWIERDVMRLRAGAEINQTRNVFGSTGMEARVRLGVPF